MAGLVPVGRSGHTQGDDLTRSEAGETARRGGSLSATARLPTSYEELVACSRQGSIFAHRWWLEAVAPGEYEIIELRTEGGLSAAWPIVATTRDGRRHLRMPALTQKLGILFAPSNAKPVETQSRNQAIVAELLERLGRFETFHQNFHENFTDWLPFHWNDFAQTTRYTYILEDLSDPDALWSGLRPHHRRVLRKAQAVGIKVLPDLGLDAFIDINRKTFARQGRDPLASDQMIERLDSAIVDNADRKIFASVDPEGRIHAAAYVAWIDGVAYYLMGGSEPELRGGGGQLLALWEAVRTSHAVATRFDFEGSMLPQIERVFRGFAARQVPYFSITKTPPPPANLRDYLRHWAQHRLTGLGNVLPGYVLGKRRQLS